MTCAHGCGNEARYVDQHGQLTCAICPIRRGEDSIRLIDVPSLLEWSRRFVEAIESKSWDTSWLKRYTGDLRAIVGKDQRK